MFWIGLSDQTWAGLQLPYDTAPWGAPGCHLYASGDVNYPVVLDAAGSAAIQISVPNNQALTGLEVFGQSACLLPGGHPTFAGSDAVSIRVR